MRHKKKTVVLDRNSAARKALMRTLAISLIMRGRVQTTPTKARAVKSMVEKLITKGKEKNPSVIRQLEGVLANKQAAMHIVNILGPKYEKRPGGYISSTKVAARKGDGAAQMMLELISDATTKSKS